MHKILFYKDKSGKMPVYEHLKELSEKDDKDSRIKVSKWNNYIQALSVYGTPVGAPYVKHIDGAIWELRPLRDRILFVAWHDGDYILLHFFVKKTQKTPKKEIEQAKREYAEIKERSAEYE